jgi:hypothetical protein
LNDARGKRHLSFDLYIAGLNESGVFGTPYSRSHELELTEEQYRLANEDGLVLRVNIVHVAAGTRQLRALVADSRSGRMGMSSAFVFVPDFAKGEFFLSGIALDTGETARQGPAVRHFRPGQVLNFVYHIYNASASKDGRAQVETHTRVLRDGLDAFAGKPTPLAFPPGEDPSRRHVSGKIRLDAEIAPGRYVLQVSVTDKLSAMPRVATQAIGFTIEQ